MTLPRGRGNAPHCFFCVRADHNLPKDTVGVETEERHRTRRRKWLMVGALCLVVVLYVFVAHPVLAQTGNDP